MIWSKNKLCLSYHQHQNFVAMNKIFFVTRHKKLHVWTLKTKVLNSVYLISHGKMALFGISLYFPPGHIKQEHWFICQHASPYRTHACDINFFRTFVYDLQKLKLINREDFFYPYIKTSSQERKETIPKFADFLLLDDILF